MSANVLDAGTGCEIAEVHMMGGIEAVDALHDNDI